MDVAELRAIYTATSQEFDRVTDHVQRRLKETQTSASGVGKSAQSQVSKEVANVQSGILKTVEQGRQAFVKSQVDAAEKSIAGTIKSTRVATEVERQAADVRLGFLKTIEAGRQNFVASQIKAAETEAQGVINAAKKIAPAVQAGTTKFDSSAFWARQGRAATNAAKTVETETKRVVTSVGATTTSAGQAISKATASVAKEVKTSATTTKTELAKLGPELLKAGVNPAFLARLTANTKIVETEAKKIGGITEKVLSDLRRLFLQNNFLFRQIGQRVAGDAGFIAVGTGKLALNFQQLAAASGGAGVELGGAAAAASKALGTFGPLGAAVAIAAAAFVAVEAAALASAAGLFFVAKSVADTEQHFEDLSRQTGLNIDNLQVLDIVTKQAGTTLDKMVNSVGQLQRKLIDASEGGTSRFSVGLKKLGIDLEDPNRALNQLIDLLIKLPAGTTRTGAAMQIFGRGGREVAGVIDQIEQNVGDADGALDRLKKQFIDAGIHINKDGTQTAAKFNDEWVKIVAQFESVKRVIGEEALPTVLSVATRFSNWVARNRVEIADWARSIEHAAEAIVHVGIALANLAKMGTIFIPIIPIVHAARGPLAEIAGGIGNISSSSSPRGPGARFSPTTRARLLEPNININTPLTVFPLTPAQQRERQAGPFGSFESQLPSNRPEPETDAQRVARRIREAFAPASRGGGGGKGEDPAQTARRLAEIALQETLRGLQAEHDALQRQLDLNFIARDQYTQDAINLELKRRQATLDGLKVELAEAEKIRKPGQRVIKVAEINARMRDEERRTAKEITKITDDAAAEQLRIGQATAQSQLRIIEAQTAQIKARIREYADFRIITEEQAAKFEEQQTLRVFNARERILQRQRDDARLSDEKRAEAQNALNELEAERRAFIEENGRRIQEAIRRDAEHVVRFAAQIREAFQRAADVRLEAREINLEPLRNSILTRHQLWDAELKFEIQHEQQRHQAVVSGLEDEAKLANIRIKNEEELAKVLRGIRAQQRAEEELHQARLQQLATQRAEQRRQELLRIADDLASIASDIFDAIGKSSDEFWKSLRQSASNFAKQLGGELFKGLLQKLITGQAEGTEGLIGAIINPLLRASGPNAQVADNTKATEDNTAAINALTQTMGGVPAISGGLSGVLQLIPGLFGGSRQHGGPAEAGKVYRIHDNEFFRPNVSGKIYNLDQMSQVLNRAGGEMRTIVALGDDAVSEAMESHRVTPQGRRAQIVRGRWNRKTGGLQFA